MIAALVAGASLAPASSRADTLHTDSDYVEHEGVVDEMVVDMTPRAEVGYRRGRRVAIKVVQLGWADVEVATAKAFLAMREAARADGVDLWIRSGFRSMEQQRWLYAAWKAGWGNKAARPGHSNHQSGRALDLYVDDPATYGWLKQHARRFGFKETVRGEPWHWEYTKPPPKKKSKKRKAPSKKGR